MRATWPYALRLQTQAAGSDWSVSGERSPGKPEKQALRSDSAAAANACERTLRHSVPPAHALIEDPTGLGISTIRLASGTNVHAGCGLDCRPRPIWR